MFTVSAAWKSAYPGAAAGILTLRNVANPERQPALDSQLRAFERQLRARYADFDRARLKALPVIQAYHAYLKRFKKTYHVQHQLESVALKGKPLPRVGALVAAMFMTELETLLLTAGHDLDAIRPPVTLGLATGHERYLLLSGQEQTLKPDDMMMADGEAVISSVIYGPDSRTRITATTQNALFAVYAPAGIGEEAVRQHLQDLAANTLLVAPAAEVQLLQVVVAN